MPRLTTPGDAEFEATLADLRREDLAYSLPGAWVNYITNDVWQYARHFVCLEDALLKVESGQIRRLIINLPPQHGKSTLISQGFSAWHLGRNPNSKIILTSYEADFAASWGRKARDALEAYGEAVFGVKVSQKSSAANFWMLEGHDGYMATAGAGGPITGKGSDLMIIDDPIKNQTDASSAVSIAAVIDWYRSVVLTRMSPTGAIIVVMTRWAYNDLCGWILSEEAKMELEDDQPWHIVSLPALATEGDILGRAVGEALWPERYNEGWLKRQRKWLGSYWFDTMYQQNPTVIGGNIIKTHWFRRYQVAPPREAVSQIVLSVDTAQRESEVNDYSVIGIWYIYNSLYYLIDVIRERHEQPQLLRVLKTVCGVQKPTAVLIEEKGGGISLIQHLMDDPTITAPVIGINPQVDKVMRMVNETAAIEAGNVYLPEEGSQPWVAEFESEMTAFPKSTYKDQADMFSQFLYWARELSSGIQMF